MAGKPTTPESIAAAASVGVAMAGQGGDRKYVVDGRAWRVRLQMIAARPPIAPTNGDPVLAPVSFGVGISVALLDEQGEVAKDGDGGLLIFDQHSVSIDAEALGNPDFDPVAAIDAAIASEIETASAILAKKDRLAAALATWTKAT